MADRNSTDTMLGRTVTAVLRVLAVLIIAATVACFAQSYRQLFDFATRHRIPLWIAPAWPVMLDAFVIIAECLLFVSIVKQWPWYTRALAWCVALAGLVASLLAQWSYMPSATLVDRGTAVVAPLGATLGLAIGLIALKWTVADHHNTRTSTGVRAGAAGADHVPVTATRRPADETRDRLLAEYIAARESGQVTVLAEHKPRRRRINGARRDVAGARAAIAEQRAAGKTPSAYAIAMTYLGGDAATRRRGDERLAKQLLDEGAAQ